MINSIWGKKNIVPINKLAARCASLKKQEVENVSEDDLWGVQTTCNEVAATADNRTRKRYDYLLQIMDRSQGTRRKKLIALISNHKIIKIKATANSLHDHFINKWKSFLAKEVAAAKAAKKEKADAARNHALSPPIKMRHPPVIPPHEAKRLNRKRKAKRRSIRQKGFGDRP